MCSLLFPNPLHCHQYILHTHTHTHRFVTLPTIRSKITEFLRFSDEVQPKIPQGHLPMRVLVMGGRDPYKNDLVKWMWGKN
jgi:hypothetical protein